MQAWYAWMTSIVTLKIGNHNTHTYQYIILHTYIYIYCVYIVYIYIDININIHVSHTSCCLIGVLLTPVVAQQGTHSCWVFMSQCLLIVFLVVRLISPSFCHILARYTCVMFMWFCVCVSIYIPIYHPFSSPGWLFFVPYPHVGGHIPCFGFIFERDPRTSLSRTSWTFATPRVCPPRLFGGFWNNTFYFDTELALILRY